jgi:hypothetical protein
MRKSAFPILLFAAVCVCKGASQSAPGRASADSEKTTWERASLFAHTDRQLYSLDQSMVIDVGILNHGPDPVYVYGCISWGYGGGLTITVRDSSGKIVGPETMDDTMLPPPKRNDDPSIFVRLKEDGDFFGAERTLPVRDIVKSPGKYTLEVEYNSPLSRSYVAEKLRKLPALWHESAAIVSKRIPFEVVP